MKKIFSVLLSVVLAASLSVVPAKAAEKTSAAEQNAQISARTKEMEKKYGIDITYPVKSNGQPSITMNNLEILDRAFNTVTPAVIKQVSKYYERRNGSRLDIKYTFSSSTAYNGGVVMAAFELETSKIYVFLPSKAGSAIISGENPIALVHEFAHAFHMMCMDSYGKNKMYDEWSSFNGGFGYNRTLNFENPNKRLFVSAYAATSFEEDFAETFAHAFVRSVPGAGFRNQLTQNSKSTGLGKKVAYIEKLLGSNLSNSSKAVSNYRKIYDTPVSMTFEGIDFSGDYLQYIGYPQPRNILRGMLNKLDLTSQKSTWVRSLGAWRVIDEYGDMYFLFPGGSWSAAKTGSVTAEAA